MIRVVGSRVLVLLPPKQVETTTESGLVLIKDPELRAHTRGFVVALGTKRGTVLLDDVCARIAEECQDARKLSDVIAAVRKLAPAPFAVAVHDLVIFPSSAGELVTWDGRDYIILDDTDIIGILEPLAKGAAA